MSEEKIDPLKLKPYKKNSKKHSERQVQRIANSIKEFGFTKPVLVWGKNQIVAGHGAVEAAISLGLTEIPIRRVDHLSEQQMRAYVIADNKLAEESKWDMGVLHEELTDLGRLDFNLELTGFSLDAVADMILENGLKDHAQESEEIRREVLGDDWESDIGAKEKVDNIEETDLGIIRTIKVRVLQEKSEPLFNRINEVIKEFGEELGEVTIA